MKTESGWLARDRRKFKKARRLLAPCIDETGGVWADLGCGEGIFTAVLYEHIGLSSEIYAVDKNKRALRALELNFLETYPEANVHPIHADFTLTLPLPALNGFVLANALHFIKNEKKAPVLNNLAHKLQTGGKVIVIEYNAKRGNFAVPHPLHEDQFLELARQLDLRRPQIVAKAPSSFLGEMYAGTALAP